MHMRPYSKLHDWLQKAVAAAIGTWIYPDLP